MKPDHRPRVIRFSQYTIARFTAVLLSAIFFFMTWCFFVSHLLKLLSDRMCIKIILSNYWTCLNLSYNHLAHQYSCQFILHVLSMYLLLRVWSCSWSNIWQEAFSVITFQTSMHGFPYKYTFHEESVTTNGDTCQ